MVTAAYDRPDRHGRPSNLELQIEIRCESARPIPAPEVYCSDSERDSRGSICRKALYLSPVLRSILTYLLS
jgi:hypothetical protein